MNPSHRLEGRESGIETTAKTTGTVLGDRKGLPDDARLPGASAEAAANPLDPIVFICAPENGHPPYVGVGPGIRACPICGRGAP